MSAQLAPNLDSIEPKSLCLGNTESENSNFLQKKTIKELSLTPRDQSRQLLNRV